MPSPNLPCWESALVYPGMVMLEAFRQAALVAARSATDRRASLVGMQAEFAKFCEFDAPVRIATTPEPGHPVGGRMVVRVTAEQDGHEVGAGTVELRLCPDTSGREHR